MQAYQLLSATILNQFSREHVLRNSMELFSKWSFRRLCPKWIQNPTIYSADIIKPNPMGRGIALFLIEGLQVMWLFKAYG